MAGYIGRTPLSEAVQSRAKYTATAGQTSFSFAYQPGFVDVFLNGIKLEDTTDYVATNGTDIVLTSVAAAGQVFEAIGLTTFSLVTGKINYSATAAPVVGDDSADGYRIGSMWIDTTNDEVYRCVDDAIGAAVWIGTTLETTDLGSLAMVSPTGTGSATTFLRGDNSWTTVDTDLTSDASPQLGGDLDTNSNDIKFKDNDKATFGAGNDLQIFHNGSNSYIQDAGTGDLVIKGADIKLISSDSENMAKFTRNGAAELYHDNSKKLATTSTGIDVTGSVTANDMNIIDSTPNLQFKDTDGNHLANITQSGSHLYIDNDSTGAIRLRTNGNQERLHIKADGNVGIGTSSPAEKLYVNSTSGDARIGLNAPTGSDTEIKFSNNGVVEYSIGHDDGTDNFVIGTTNVDTPKLSIDKGGNVGIGTTSPDAPLTVKGEAFIQEEGSSGNSAIRVQYGTDGNITLRDRARLMMVGYDGVLELIDGANVLTTKITSDGGSYLNGGNVGIGTSSPSAKLEIKSTSTDPWSPIASFVGPENGAKLLISNIACGSDKDRAGILWENQGIINVRMWMGDDGNLYSNGGNPTSDTDGNKFLTTGNITDGSINTRSISGRALISESGPGGSTQGAEWFTVLSTKTPYSSNKFTVTFSEGNNRGNITTFGTMTIGIGANSGNIQTTMMPSGSLYNNTVNGTSSLNEWRMLIQDPTNSNAFYRIDQFHTDKYWDVSSIPNFDATNYTTHVVIVQMREHSYQSTMMDIAGMTYGSMSDVYYGSEASGPLPRCYYDNQRTDGTVLTFNSITV